MCLACAVVVWMRAVNLSTNMRDHSQSFTIDCHGYSDCIALAADAAAGADADAPGASRERRRTCAARRRLEIGRAHV